MRHNNFNGEEIEEHSWSTKNFQTRPPQIIPTPGPAAPKTATVWGDCCHLQTIYLNSNYAQNKKNLFKITTPPTISPSGIPLIIMNAREILKQISPYLEGSHGGSNTISCLLYPETIHQAHPVLQKCSQHTTPFHHWTL